MEHFILKSQILENQILLLLEYISEVGNWSFGFLSWSVK